LILRLELILTTDRAWRKEALFQQALGVLPARAATPTQIWPGPISYLMIDFDTPQQWRLMMIAKLAAMYFPETATRLEQAASDVAALVDEVVAAAPENLRPDIYVRLEERLRELARPGPPWRPCSLSGSSHLALSWTNSAARGTSPGSPQGSTLRSHRSNNRARDHKERPFVSPGAGR
jgi:hypothetical protein